VGSAVHGLHGADTLPEGEEVELFTAHELTNLQRERRDAVAAAAVALSRRTHWHLDFDTNPAPMSLITMQSSIQALDPVDMQANVDKVRGRLAPVGWLAVGWLLD
jgi:hypothetical protein